MQKGRLKEAALKSYAANKLCFLDLLGLDRGDCDDADDLFNAAASGKVVYGSG